MKHQALLLSLVILISLLINPVRNMAFENSKSQSASAIFSRPESNITTSDVVNSDVLVSQPNIINGNDSEISPCISGKSNFTSQTILVKNLKQYSSNDEIIFQLNPEKRWPIASLAKLMTAVIAFEKMDMEKEITLSEKAVLSEGIAGNFKTGEIFKLKDLSKAMLISSSNDAAVAIAENFETGEDGFINEMQKKASALKMFSTTYLEPTGLSFVNQSTVGDLSKLVNYIYFNYPEILEISREKQSGILELKSGKSRTMLATDKFAGDNDFLGGKTGFIEAAGRNLIAVFDMKGSAILTITLGAEDAFTETEKLKNLIGNCQ